MVVIGDLVHQLASLPPLDARSAPGAAMGRGKKKPSAGRGGETPRSCPSGKTNENKAKSCPSGETNENKLKMNGELKIDSFYSPTKTNSARAPLQEDNSTPYHEGKCGGKVSPDVPKKVEAEMKTAAVAEQESNDAEPKEHDLSDSKKEQAQKQTAPETLKKPSTADRKPEPQRISRVKSNRKKVQGTKSPNRKVTDYFPVRRSCRKNKTELECEVKKRIDELIQSGKEEGMKIDHILGKGRGVIATQDFSRGDFVVEYHGDLIEITDAKKREAEYAQDSATGCYMYYFQYLNKTYCVDATKETNRLGRLINHSKNGNCHTKLHDINNVPHLILIASRDIKAGEELLYDYGDRSKSSIEAHPWLKL